MNIQTESTEDKIISATFRLIRKDGIDKVTTKKIANTNRLEPIIKIRIW